MQPEPKKHVSHWIAWSFIALAVGLVAYGTWVYFDQIATIYDNTVIVRVHKKTTTTKPTATATTTDATADWQTYANATYGFSFKYPKDWSVTNKTGGKDASEITENRVRAGLQKSLDDVRNQGFVISAGFYGDRLCTSLSDGVYSELCPGFTSEAMNKKIAGYPSSYTNMKVQTQTIGDSIQGYIITGKLQVDGADSAVTPGDYDYKEIIFKNNTGQYYSIATITNSFSKNIWDGIVNTFQFTK